MQAYWNSLAYNDEVGLDSQNMLAKQRKLINKKSLKERALKRKVKKVFLDEMEHEDQFQEEALRYLYQTSDPAVGSLLTPMYEIPMRADGI